MLYNNVHLRKFVTNSSKHSYVRMIYGHTSITLLRNLYWRRFTVVHYILPTMAPAYGAVKGSLTRLKIDGSTWGDSICGVCLEAICDNWSLWMAGDYFYTYTHINIWDDDIYVIAFPIPLKIPGRICGCSADLITALCSFDIAASIGSQVNTFCEKSHLAKCR